MSKTLLLADDSVVIQKLVGLSFANEEVELVTTDNGDDALIRAREIRPDLILADVVMPGMNGYEVCQAIKNDPALRHIPVLLLTGTFEAFDEDRAAQVGSDGHITKPFEAQGLVDRVTDLLSRTPPAPAPSAEAPVALATPPIGASGPMEAAPTSESDQAYDFFDDEVQELAPPEEKPVATAAPSVDDAFEFGADLDPLSTTAPGAGEPDTLDTNFELDSDTTDDLTVAVMPESAPMTPPPVPVDLHAPDATRVAMDETMIRDDLSAPPAPAARSASTPPPIQSLDASLPDPPAAPLDPRASPPIPVEEPGQTILADDLFAESAPPPLPTTSAEATPQPAPSPSASSSSQGMPPALDSGFEFGFDEPAAPEAASEVGEDITAPSAPDPVAPADLGLGGEPLDTDPDPLAGMNPEPPIEAFGNEPGSDAPALADAAESTQSGYDVSISDLGDPLSASGSDMPATDFGAEPVAAPGPAPVTPEMTDGDPGISEPEPLTSMPSDPATSPDLSPVMRDRIHETLEKVAWEAFADVSDSIVRQVLQRVESIVWEVVPQMAEALIQEEIRRMKGDD